MVVDDQPVVRAGFAAIVDAEPDLEVVGVAADGAAAVALAAEVEPDVVIMDIRMPGVDGITAAAALTAAPGGPKVLVLTTFDLDEYVFRALRAGASGFLLKDAAPAELLAAIRVVASGESMLAPAVTRRIIDAYVQTAPSGPGSGHGHGDGPGPGPGPGMVGGAGGAGPATLAALTPREAQVLTLIASGLSNAEIGTELGVATGTVKTHVNALLAKLGVRDRVQATIVAYDLGLVHPGRSAR